MRRPYRSRPDPRGPDDPSRPKSHGHGIFSLDSGYLRPDFDAIHLVIEAGRAIVIDDGTSHFGAARCWPRWPHWASSRRRSTRSY
ncbi:MAG: hypothetical protein R3E68_21145 [Burkholderiaceae bacterium]